MPPLPPQTPLEIWFEKNRKFILWGVVLYLFGVNQAQKTQIETSNARANLYEGKYIRQVQWQSEAANRIALRAILHNDTGYVLAVDSLPGLAPHLTGDTVGKP